MLSINNLNCSVTEKLLFAINVNDILVINFLCILSFFPTLTVQLLSAGDCLIFCSFSILSSVQCLLSTTFQCPIFCALSIVQFFCPLFFVHCPMFNFLSTGQCPIFCPLSTVQRFWAGAGGGLLCYPGENI